MVNPTSGHIALLQTTAVPVVLLMMLAYEMKKPSQDAAALENSARSLGANLSLSTAQTRDLVRAVMNCAQTVQGQPTAMVDLMKTLYEALPAAIRQKLPSPQKIQFDLIDAEKEANESPRVSWRPVGLSQTEMTA
jgi:hypothetical protein